MVGVTPKFSPLDVLRALLILSGDPMSRADIVKSLRLGEGSVRSILDELKEGKFAVSSRRGHALSMVGLDLQREVIHKVSAPQQVKCAVFANPFCSAVVVKNPGMAIDPVRLRDVALKWGADAALVLIKGEGSLKAPFIDKNLDLSAVEKVIHSSEGDVVVVVFADAKSSSEIAALAVALHASPWLRGLVAKRFMGKSSLPLP